MHLDPFTTGKIADSSNFTVSISKETLKGGKHFWISAALLNLVHTNSLSLPNRLSFFALSRKPDKTTINQLESFFTI